MRTILLEVATKYWFASQSATAKVTVHQEVASIQDFTTATFLEIKFSRSEESDNIGSHQNNVAAFHDHLLIPGEV